MSIQFSANQPTQQQPIRVGLTGGIASGKSMIKKMIEQAGVHTIDADDIVHDLYQHDPQVSQEIQQIFGSSVVNPDGTINRKALGAIVFNDKAKLQQLNSIFHPKVRQKIEGFFTQHSNDKLAVAIVPLLFESNLAQFYDRVWLVKATVQQQIDRLVKTRGLTQAEAQSRINSQMSFADKLKLAQALPSHEVIDNTGTLAQTEQQIKQLILNA